MELFWKSRIWVLAGAGLLFLLTGGYGLLVPRIHGLNYCTDFVLFKWAGFLLAAAVLVGFGLLGVAAEATPPVLSRGITWCGAVLAASVCFNIAAEQDPCFAWLNWRATYLHYDPDYGRGIENHEWIQHDVTLDIYYAGGPGMPIPAELQERYGRTRF